MKFLILVVLLAICSSRAPAPDEHLQVFFVEFEADTLTPVTTKNIEEAYDISSLISSKLGNVLEILDSAKSPGLLKRDFIRLKIRSGKRQYVVDQNGTVSSARGSFKLNNESFYKLKLAIWTCLPHPPLPKRVGI